jgi:hypothetical protein
MPSGGLSIQGRFTDRFTRPAPLPISAGMTGIRAIIARITGPAL